MATGAERMQAGAAGETSLAIDNLRAFVILLVLSFHSVLAYIAFLPASPFAFDDPPFLWRAFPIVDTTTLVRLRSVLRLAGRVSDVVFPAAVGAVHLAEPVAQGAASFPVPTGCCGSACRSPRW